MIKDTIISKKAYVRGIPLLMLIKNMRVPELSPAGECQTGQERILIAGHQQQHIEIS